MATTKRVKKADFKLSNYIADHKITRMTSFAFKEAEIAKLPLMADDRTIDLYDSSLERGEWKLVLRLQKTRKTFHIRNRSGMKGKIGVWIPKPNSNHYPRGFVSLAQARKEFYKRIEELKALTAEAAEKQKWTIEQYLDNQYIQDRLVKPTKDGNIHHVTESTIREIKQGFPLWINKRLIDAHNDWPEQFANYWNSKECVVPRTQERKTGISSETQRKYYSMINAMFHICVKMGYLRHNPIDNKTYLFKRNEKQEIRTYEDDFGYEEIIDFIFDECSGSQAGKLMISTIILTGARPAEVYRNKASNFNEKKRNVFIPGAISKNSGQRRIAIRVERYWIELKKYKRNNWQENPNDFMFPSNKSNTGHSTENMYKQIWQQIKHAYKITHGVLYDSRHTFATESARESNVEVTAGLIGNSIATTYKYYYKNKEEDAERVVEAIHTKKRKQTNNAPTSTATTRSVISIGKLPEEVAEFFEMFRSGKELPGDNQLYKDDWMSFISKVKKRVERGRMGEDTEDWLDAVT
ncbi:site-specific integrase [Amphritea atlantica]|uniref:Site-specific integrase n=1 Tax=Amphritea atlantica TaxID=355243 RepID=A0ABY5GU45_9GAMM|nr:site-specific integrase [Amphritea atlantica]